MSVYASSYVWEHSVHKGTELLLLLAIADIAHRNGVAFPSVRTLARYIRMSERNTTRVLAKLEKSGELKIKRNGGPHGTHLMQIVMNQNLLLFRPDEGGDKLSGAKLAGDTRVQGGVTNSATRGDTAMSPEPTEPNTEPNNKARFALPGWVPAKAWADYEEMRRRVSKPMTDKARELAVRRLKELHNAGFEPQAVLDQSVFNSWQGLFEIKPNATGAAGASLQKRWPKCRYCPKESSSIHEGIPHCGAQRCTTLAFDRAPAPQAEAA